MTTTPELIRVPSKRYQRTRADYITASTPRYDYTSADGRWYIQQHRGCGGGWAVIDTSGEYAGCTCCRRNTDGHVTIARTLAAAKAFISEWAA